MKYIEYSAVDAIEQMLHYVHVTAYFFFIILISDGK